ncbi:MAG: hypothetical protein HY073_03115 [Deltaproteobacteria bacterium]|nr:hypothetical protein [Deltaproteobacteria bacterium]
MKSVTEFPSYILVKGIAAKAALVAEGKTPEEIQVSLGTTFKFEGDRLKYFFNALDVAAQNTGFSRLVVKSLSEGESAPTKAVKVEELYYIPEFLILAPPQQPARDSRGRPNRGGGGGSRGGRGDNGPKGTPWGLSPEQKAAKKGGGKKTAGA